MIKNFISQEKFSEPSACSESCNLSFERNVNVQTTVAGIQYISMDDKHILILHKLKFTVGINFSYLN